MKTKTRAEKPVRTTPPAPAAGKALVTANELAAILGVSTRTVYLRRNDAAFPRLILLGPRSPRYAVADVPDYLASLATADRPPEPAQLARGRTKRMPATPPTGPTGAVLEAMARMTHTPSPKEAG